MTLMPYSCTVFPILYMCSTEIHVTRSISSQMQMFWTAFQVEYLCLAPLTKQFCKSSLFVSLSLPLIGNIWMSLCKKWRQCKQSSAVLPPSLMILFWWPCMMIATQKAANTYFVFIQVGSLPMSSSIKLTSYSLTPLHGSLCMVLLALKVRSDNREKSTKTL